jgi:TPR repeat protein
LIRLVTLLIFAGCAAAEAPPMAKPETAHDGPCPPTIVQVPASPPDEDEAPSKPATPTAPNASLDATACFVGRIEACRTRCEAAEAHGCAELGKSMIWGINVPVDSHGGQAVLEKACALDHAEACFLVAQWLSSLAPMAERDDVRARKLFDKSCTLGNGSGCATMANLLDVTKDPRATEYVSRACDLGIASSCWQLGR